MNARKLLPAVAGAALILFCTDSYALNIYAPYVEKGVMEIESRNRFDFDKRSDENNFRQHEVELEYGLTSMWKAAISGEMEKENGNDYKYTATEIENIFQLTDVGQYFLDAGLQADYEFANDGADGLEVFLLLAKNYTNFTTAANIGFVKEVGSNSNANPEGEIKWMAKYNYIPVFNPGVEYYGDFGEITHSGDYSSQKHLLGPVIYGKLVPGLKYETGVLFGISKAAQDYALKLNVEYEFPVGW